ncbi:MAG: hypothetical protein GTN36_02110 [Candidatus Aenigmarchaeota archaeon]|nr:hypothetical protein [Candidatus Aenigmarchaeota archaeon]
MPAKLFADLLTEYLRIVDEKGDSDKGVTAFTMIYPRILCASIRGDVRELRGMYRKMVEKEKERNGKVPHEFPIYKNALSASINFSQKN